jgi:polysaccharide pyruvyl transferase WcaK-like protein
VRSVMWRPSEELSISTQPGSRPVRLLLSENTPALNRGEAAILRGLVRSFTRHLGPIDLLLLSNDPVNDSREYADVCRVLPGPDARSSRIARRLPRRARVLMDAARIVAAGCLAQVAGPRHARRLVSDPILKAYLGADVILIGHDNYIVGPGLSPQFVAKVAFSRLTGKVSVLCGGSFGPFGRGLPESLAAWVLKECTKVVLREPASYEYAEQLVGERPHISLGADPAFLMPAADDPGAEVPGTGGREVIGFTIARGSLVDESAFAESEPGLDAAARRTRHISVVTEVIRRVADETGCRILLVAHSLEDAQNDLVPAWEILTRLRDEVDVEILDPTLPAPEVKRELSRLSLLVAERVHSAIAATSEGVPVVAVSKPSDFRAYGIIGSMLGLEECLYDVRGLEASALVDLIVQRWKERARLRTRIEAALPAILAAADSVGRVTATTLDRT